MIPRWLQLALMLIGAIHVAFYVACLVFFGVAILAIRDNETILKARK